MNKTTQEALDALSYAVGMAPASLPVIEYLQDAIRALADEIRRLDEVNDIAYRMDMYREHGTYP